MLNNLWQLWVMGYSMHADQDFRCHLHLWSLNYGPPYCGSWWWKEKWRDEILTQRKKERKTEHMHKKTLAQSLKCGPREPWFWTSTHQHTIHWMPRYYWVVDEPQPELIFDFNSVTNSWGNGSYIYVGR